MKDFKSKKQIIFSILGLLVIVASIPIAVFLVKQRQEIRKEAASGSITKCGVTISTASGGGFNGSNFTGNYSLNNNSGKTVEMKIQLHGCACDKGNLSQCNTGCIEQTKNLTLSPGTSSQSITTPSKNNCGTFQTDLKVIYCKYEGPYGSVEDNDTSLPVWHLYNTNKDCTSPTPTRTPTPTPGNPIWGRWNTNITCSLTTPTPTPVEETPTPTPTPVAVTEATSAPQLPEAGFAWPTFGVIFGGITFILIASVLFLL